MSDDQVFVDTSVLVYAHDKDAGDKYRIAKEKVKSLWNRPLWPSISIRSSRILCKPHSEKGQCIRCAGGSHELPRVGCD